MMSKRYPLLPDSRSCRLCKATAHQIEFWRECLIGSSQTIRLCGHCGAVYLGPDFTKDTLTHFYETSYRRVFLEGSPNSWSQGRHSAFFKQRGDDFYAAQRLALLAPFIPRDGGLLELGSGSGAFLGTVASKYPHLRLFACEPDEDFRSLRLGEAPVQFIPWGDFSEVTDNVRLIVAFHTLEHLQDVVGFLQEAMRTLQPGGHLALEVPDVLSGWETRNYVHPAHLTYFSEHSLKRVLCSVGFEIVSCGPQPVKGVLGENIWAVVRKPFSSLAEAPVTAASADEIAQLRQKLQCARWTWKNALNQQLKRIGIHMLPLDFLAWIKRKKLQYRRMGEPPSNFSQFECALRALFGEEGATVRHETYFLAQKATRWRQSIRASLALLRDMVHCFLLSRHKAPLNAIVAAVSLARFEPLLVSTAQSWAPDRPVTYLNRPHSLRSAASAKALHAPRLSDWQFALQPLVSQLPATASIDGLETWTLRCCIARHRLWQAAIKRTLEQAPRDAVLLLHNDFDIFSRAAVAAAKKVGIPSICVQHGLPTDEYFPTSADKQLVWGAISAEVYIQHGTPAASIMSGTSLASATFNDESPAPPNYIALVSQTHTQIFGEDIPARLLSLAKGLHAATESHEFKILLHPEEDAKWHRFKGIDPERLCLPPHQVLTAPSERGMVIGFCSTALINAALAGHYVAAMDWKSTGSQGAVAVGQPPMRLHDTDEILDLFERLTLDEELRKSWQAEQLEWLARTLTPLPTA